MEETGQKERKSLKGGRKMSPRVFKLSIKVYCHPDLQATLLNKLKYLS